MAASWGRGRTSRGAEAGHPFLEQTSAIGRKEAFGPYGR